MCDFIFMLHRGRKVLDGTLQAIQERFGADTLRVRVTGANVAFDRLPGVERVNDFGRFQELRTTPGADPQAVLRALSGQAAIEHFEIARPRLHDIFVRIAGPAPAAEEEDARA
jgi:ABC-2 type transport system ATP-binding protein